MDPLDSIAADLGGYSPHEADWAPLYQSAGKQYGVDPLLLRALTLTESGGDLGARSPVGAEGPTQIMPSNKPWLGITDSYNPTQAIPGTAKFLQQALAQSHGDVMQALRLYEGGPDQSKWGPQNAAYPMRVMQHYRELGGDPQALLFPSRGQGGAGTGAGAGTGIGADPLAEIEGTLGAPGAPQASPSVDGKADPKAAAEAPPPSQVGGQSPPAGGQELRNAPPNVVMPGRYDWRLPDEALYYATLGQSNRLVSALKGGYDWLRGAQPGASFGDYYNANKGMLDEAQRGYEAEPGNSADMLMVRAGAGLPLTAAGVGLAGAGVRAGAALAGRAIPAVAPYVDAGLNYLSGGYGATAEGGGLPGWLARRGSDVAGATGQGETAIALNADTNKESLRDQMLTDLPIATGLGAVAAPAVNATAGRLANPPITPEVANAVRGLQGAGVEVPAARASSSNNVRGVYDTVVGAPHGDGGFTRALGKKVGLDQDTITPTDWQAARDKIQAGYDNVLPKLSVDLDPQAQSELKTVLDSAEKNLPSPSPELTKIQQLAAQVQNGFGLDRNFVPVTSGPLSGKEYSGLTGYGSTLYDAMHDEKSQVASYAQKIKASLDGALDRTAAGNPQDLEDYRQLRQQLSDWHLFEPVVAKAGPAGLLSPKAVAQAIRQKYGVQAPANLEPFRNGATVLPEPNTLGSSGGPTKARQFAEHALTFGLPVAALTDMAENGLLAHHPMLAASALTSAGMAGAGAMGLKRYLTSPAYNRNALARALGEAPPWVPPTGMAALPLSQLYEEPSQ